jgi:glycosyltransferase involved in cell wall biosynthesis
VAKVSRVVLIGEKDKAAIEAACRRHGVPPIANVVWGPHGVDVERFSPRGPAAEEPGAVAMSGVMRYAPNVEAALWFAAEVWPLVRRERPDARFYLVGRDPDAKVQALHGRDGIEVTGTVDEPAGLDRQGRGLRGAGPRRGGPAEQAARGARHGPGGGRHPGGERGHPRRARPRPRAGAGADAFARAVLDLLADPARRAALGAAGRRFVEERWTWEGPFLGLETAFHEALAEAGR